MVIDTSVLLSVIFKENTASWCLEQLHAFSRELRMSTVNLAETLIHVQDKQPSEFEKIKEAIFLMGIRLVPPSIKQSILVAKARLDFPINLGDCFAYALAMDEECPILTLDKDFKKTDAQVLIPR